jgi:hypothetical protein
VSHSHACHFEFEIFRQKKKKLEGTFFEFLIETNPWFCEIQKIEIKRQHTEAFSNVDVRKTTRKKKGGKMFCLSILLLVLLGAAAAEPETIQAMLDRQFTARDSSYLPTRDKLYVAVDNMRSAIAEVRRGGGTKIGSNTVFFFSFFFFSLSFSPLLTADFVYPLVVFRSMLPGWRRRALLRF